MWLKRENKIKVKMKTVRLVTTMRLMMEPGPGTMRMVGTKARQAKRMKRGLKMRRRSGCRRRTPSWFSPLS
jgi:hypothetical protein